ncbi:MAG TPA: hypothetical protein VL120_05860, partial [Solirubrobacteraceae bacterium]|nr:hypothetical protein [Solirubrobacteraceae bacterium]
EDPGADPPPARREHVEALAIALARARDRDALRRGFEEDEAAALTGEHGTGEALALGRALARGRR